ncbi:MAG: hypothetical protein NTZ53_14470 [Cyanobacteria bacterium]|nr:hypothetical protein [Cyanobacteriota bacterium]
MAKEKMKPANGFEPMAFALRVQVPSRAEFLQGFSRSVYQALTNGKANGSDGCNGTDL